MSVTLPAETCMQVPPLCNAATENWRRLAQIRAAGAPLLHSVVQEAHWGTLSIQHT